MLSENWWDEEDIEKLCVLSLLSIQYKGGGSWYYKKNNWANYCIILYVDIKLIYKGGDYDIFYIDDKLFSYTDLPPYY